MTEAKRGRPKKTETEKLEEQFDRHEQTIKDLTMDRMNLAPKEEVEKQTKRSQREIDRENDIYLKPIKTIASYEKFNEKFRSKYDFDKEYVHFIAENKEIIGDQIEMWTKPYPGMPAEFWQVPVNTAIWGPRYLAEQIKSKFYHRLKSENKVTSEANEGQYFGTMVVDTTVARLDAYPATKQRSIFMGAESFASSK